MIRFLSFEFLPSFMSMKLLMLQQKTNFIYLKVLATRGSKAFSYKHHPKTKENKGKKFEPKIKMDQVFSPCSMLVNYKCKWSPWEKWQLKTSLLLDTGLACKQALLFGQAKQASRERASDAPRGLAARSPVLTRLASLTQIGKLARRLIQAQTD